MPTPDNARIAPADRLLYQYAFSSEFGDSALGKYVHRIFQICSMGGYIKSVPLRHAILSASANNLGFEHAHVYHFGVSLRMLSTTVAHIPYKDDGHICSFAARALLSVMPDIHFPLLFPAVSSTLIMLRNGTIDNIRVRFSFLDNIYLHIALHAFLTLISRDDYRIIRI